MEDIEFNNNLKVLMTTDTVGGVWTYCIELCRSLPQVEFHLFTSGDKMQEAQLKEVSELKNIRVYETEFKLEWMENPWNDIDNSGEYLLQLERKIKPNIIHLNSYSYASLPFKARKIVVAHSDVFTWWNAVQQEMPPADYEEYFKRVYQGLQSADLVIAPSKAMAESVTDMYGISTSVKVIYNGRSKMLFEKAEKKQTIFSMGRLWDDAKNISLLLHAACNINYEIKIAGAVNFETDKLLIENDNVQYLGKLSPAEVIEQLSEAAVYVLPAKYEPFGLSVLEAAFSGCALVLGNISSLKEIWGHAALYIDTDDANDLAEIVNDLMNDAEKLLDYSNRAEMRANLYSTSIQAEAYLETYKHLINSDNKILKEAIL